MSEGVASWWLMSWGTAQAGDRASQTGHYGQWWDRDAEQLADTSGKYNLHHASFSPLQHLRGVFNSPCLLMALGVGYCI